MSTPHSTPPANSATPDNVVNILPRFSTPKDAPTMKQWEKEFPGLFNNTILLQATANVIMQLAEPGVGYGVKESIVKSGNLFTAPWKRTRTTLQYLAVATLGSAEEKLAYRHAIDKVHQLIRSGDNSPVKYNAFNTDLQLWVASCLFWGYLDSWEKLRGRKADIATQETMLRMLEPLATTLQVKPENWHQSIDDFNRYWDDKLNHLEIDDVIRQYLTNIANLKFLNRFFQLFFARFNRFITAGYLPPRIREQMQLTWNDKKQKRFRFLLRFLGHIDRITPLFIRGLTMNLMLWDFRKRLKHNKPLV